MGPRERVEGSAEDASVSRRGFLGASGAFGAAALSRGRARALVEQLAGEDQAEVVVVGAGLAGLSAARVLREAGVDVLVVEQRDQAGGRIAEQGGGAALTPTTALETHAAVLSLGRSVGVGTSVERTRGSTVVTVAGTRRLADPGSLCGDPDLDREVGVALSRLNLMAAEVDPEAPWQGANATDRDRVALGAWMADNVGSREGRALFSLVTRAIWAAEPAEISLLHALATVAGAGGIGPLVNASLNPGWPGPQLVPGAGDHELVSCRACQGGADPWTSVPRAEAPVAHRRIEGGVSALVDGLGRVLRDRMRSATTVRSVEQDDHGVKVAGENFSVRASHAILALPPAAAARIVFSPELPAGQRSVMRAFGGDVFTMTATSPGTIWGGTGSPAWGATTDGPVTVARAHSSASRSSVVVSARGSGAHALGALDGAERQRVFERSVVALFESPSLPLQVVAEQDGRGAGGWGVVIPPGGAVSSLRSLREPHGRVYWAGTERASAWAGWLEGAVRSGEAAANRVLGAAATAAPASAVVP